MHSLVTAYIPHQYKGIVRASTIQVCFTVYSRTRVYYSLVLLIIIIVFGGLLMLLTENKAERKT